MTKTTGCLAMWKKIKNTCCIESENHYHNMLTNINWSGNKCYWRTIKAGGQSKPIIFMEVNLVNVSGAASSTFISRIL